MGKLKGRVVQKGKTLMKEDRERLRLQTDLVGQEMSHLPDTREAQGRILRSRTIPLNQGQNTLSTISGPVDPQVLIPLPPPPVQTPSPPKQGVVQHTRGMEVQFDQGIMRNQNPPVVAKAKPPVPPHKSSLTPPSGMGNVASQTIPPQPRSSETETVEVETVTTPKFTPPEPIPEQVSDKQDPLQGSKMIDSERNILSELALTPQSTQVGVKRHPQWNSSWDPNQSAGHTDYSHSDSQLLTPQTPSPSIYHQRGNENSSRVPSRVLTNENQTCEQIEQTGDNAGGLSNYLNYPSVVPSNINRPLTQGEERHQRRHVTFNQVANQVSPPNDMTTHTGEVSRGQYDNYPTQTSLPLGNEEQIDFNSLRNPSTPKPILYTLRQPKGTVLPINPNPEGEPHPEGAPLQPKYFSGTVEGGTEGNFHGYYFPHPPVTYRTTAPLTWNKIPKGSPQCQNHTSSVIITIVPQYPTGRQISRNLEFYFPN